MSEARKAADSVTPMSNGETRRAATTRSGWSAWTTATENAPRTRPSASRTAPTRPAPGSADNDDSIRWARTSVSVPDTKQWPDPASASVSSTWFSMIPLWTNASRPEQSAWG